jgi:hypothetical protein
MKPTNDDFRWQAESDARVLKNAIEIQQDDERLQRALTIEAEQAARSQALLKAYRKEPSKRVQISAQAATKKIQHAADSFTDKIKAARKG